MICARGLFMSTLKENTSNDGKMRDHLCGKAIIAGVPRVGMLV